MKTAIYVTLALVLMIGKAPLGHACSSFAVYGGDEPVYGMNWDYEDVELEFAIEVNSGVRRFLLRAPYSHDQPPIDGYLFYNEHGLFGNIQAAQPYRNVNRLRTERRLQLYTLLYRSTTYQTVQEVQAQLDGHRLLMDSYAGADATAHSLYADVAGSAVILEPGIEQNHILPLEKSFMVMTNFFVHDLLQMDPEQIEDFLERERRYLTAQNMIEETLDTFEMDTGLEVLEATSVPNWTRFSFVILPELNIIYLTLKADFSRVWLIDLIKGTIETHRGFADYRIESLDETGVTNTTLFEWK